LEQVGIGASDTALGDSAGSAEELVSAVAYDHVVGSDVRAKGLTDELRPFVAGQMALTVVDLFEARRRRESEHKQGTGALRTLGLAGTPREPEPPRPGAG